MGEAKEEIVFYHNKLLAGMKFFISMSIVIGYIIMAINIGTIIPDFLGRILTIIFFVSFFYGFNAYEDFQYNLLLKLSFEKLTYYYWFFERVKTDISFYWKDIIKIEKIDIFFYKRICIIYKDNIENKIRKHKIKIKNSENSCEEIYETLIKKLEEYKKLKIDCKSGKG